MQYVHRYFYNVGRNLGRTTFAWSAHVVSAPYCNVLYMAFTFLLGVEVGANPEIVASLKLLGLEAVVIAVAGTLGSVLLAWALWRYVERSNGK